MADECGWCRIGERNFGAAADTQNAILINDAVEYVRHLSAAIDINGRYQRGKAMNLIFELEERKAA